MARDAMTNDEFRKAAEMLATTGDLKAVARAHPHIDPKYFDVNKDALHRAAKVLPQEGGAPAGLTTAEKVVIAQAAAERKAERAEDAKEDAATSRHWPKR